MGAVIFRELDESGVPASRNRTDRRPDFRKLLGPVAWENLPPAVRARFAIEAHDGKTTVYRGQMQVKASLGGRWFAQLCRLIGTPVAPFVGAEVPVHVGVFDCAEGVVWERRYEFPGRAPTIVRSIKQVDVDGTLIEALNAGLHMRLRVYEDRGAVHFVSIGYFFRAGWLRFSLPDWFLPGTTHVIHEDQGNGRFRFTMQTEHRWFGEMFFQDGIFE